MDEQGERELHPLLASSLAAVPGETDGDHDCRRGIAIARWAWRFVTCRSRKTTDGMIAALREASKVNWKFVVPSGQHTPTLARLRPGDPVHLDDARTHDTRGVQGASAALYEEDPAEVTHEHGLLRPHREESSLAQPRGNGLHCVLLDRERLPGPSVSPMASATTPILVALERIRIPSSLSPVRRA
jgi:hypothetical protein